KGSRGFISGRSEGAEETLPCGLMTGGIIAASEAKVARAPWRPCVSDRDLESQHIAMERAAVRAGAHCRRDGAATQSRCDREAVVAPVRCHVNHGTAP